MHAVKEGKKTCRPTAGPQPLKWAHIAPQARETFQKVQGCPCCKHARLNFDSHKQSKDMCTASANIQDTGRNPGHPETSKLTSIRTL